MEIFQVHEKSNEKIVFETATDLVTFFNEINNGNWVTVEYEKDNIKYGELISPDIAADVKDKKIIIMSKEKV